MNILIKIQVLNSRIFDILSSDTAIQDVIMVPDVAQLKFTRNILECEYILPSL
jgi:hypothetical protein